MGRIKLEVTANKAILREHIYLLHFASFHTHYGGGFGPRFKRFLSKFRAYLSQYLIDHYF